MLDNSSKKSTFVDSSKIGECAPQQPLSGVSFVGGARAVNGMSHGGYMIMKETESAKVPTAQNSK